MRLLSKDPHAASKARAAEQKANEEAGLKSISLSSAALLGASTTASSATAAPSTGKKKPVFKSTLQPHNATAAAAAVPTGPGDAVAGTDEGVSGEAPLRLREDNDPKGMVRNGWVGEAYEPGFVTGCDDPRCGGCRGGVVEVGVVGG